MDRSIPVKGFVFLKNSENRLDSEYLLTLPIIKEVAPENSPSTSSGTRGRLCVPIGTHQNQRRSENTALFSEYGFEHICSAYVQGLRSIGELEAKLVEKLRLADWNTMSLFLNIIENASQSKILSDQEEFSVFIDLDETKAQYMYLKNLTNEWDPKNAQGAQESRNKEYIRLYILTNKKVIDFWSDTDLDCP